MENLSDSYEQGRLAAIEQLELSNSSHMESLQPVMRLVAAYFKMPIAYISLIERSDQWVMAQVGSSFGTIPREQSFCNHTVARRDILVVEDALRDPLFNGNAMVTGSSRIRFYAGAPLMTADGHAIGALCLMDHRPRRFSQEQRTRLSEFAAFVMSHIRLRRSIGRVDPVSGMGNKFQLVEELTVLQMHAYGQVRALAYVDMPNAATAFDISTALGAAVYDELVYNIAQKMRRLFSPFAKLYHVDDTRFALLSLDEDVDGFSASLRGMEAALSESVDSMNVPLKIVHYCGVYNFAVGAESAFEAPRRALSALHQALIDQRRWSVYREHDDVVHQRSFRLLNDVHAAIASGGFHLLYQPKLDLKTGVCVGVEALLRWDHPSLGAVAPAEFIPMVEKTALIHPLTNWVLHTALAQLSDWQSRGYPIKMAINFSARNFEEEDIGERVRRACVLYGIDPGDLEIECTEGIWMESPQALATLRQLRSLGVVISLDDFGTGYSNFSYLQKLPATVVKIDQSLIRNLHLNPRDQRIVRTLIMLGRSLDYRIVAEGVETADALRLITAWGADEAQGYWIARPLSASAFEQRYPFRMAEAA